MSGSAPPARLPASAASADAASPRIAASRMAIESLRPGRPSISVTLSIVSLSAVIAAAWSRSESESRTEPSAARAMAVIASLSALMDSRSQID